MNLTNRLNNILCRLHVYRDMKKRIILTSDEANEIARCVRRYDAARRERGG